MSGSSIPFFAARLEVLGQKIRLCRSSSWYIYYLVVCGICWSRLPELNRRPSNYESQTACIPQFLSIPSCADSLVFARFSNCLGIFQHRPVSLCAPFRRVRPLLTELGYRRRATVEHKNARARIMRNVVYLSSDKCRNLIRAIIYFTDHGELRNTLSRRQLQGLLDGVSSSAQRDLDASSVNRHGDE
jgi:hypothetical protein